MVIRWSNSFKLKPIGINYEYLLYFIARHIMPSCIHWKGPNSIPFFLVQLNNLKVTLSVSNITGIKNPHLLASKFLFEFLSLASLRTGILRLWFEHELCIQYLGNYFPQISKQVHLFEHPPKESSNVIGHTEFSSNVKRLSH